MNILISSVLVRRPTTTERYGVNANEVLSVYLPELHKKIQNFLKSFIFKFVFITRVTRSCLCLECGYAVASVQ